VGLFFFPLIGLASRFVAVPRVKGRGLGPVQNLWIGAVVILLASAPAGARAQYSYPAGYGGYGWGGWGSTPQSSLARGLGYFNMGRGTNNELSALAGSINTDTVIRWNQYAYQSHLTASNNYRAHLLARRKSINQARAEIQEQLRDNPTNRDITDGDALNLLLDGLTNAANGSSAMRRITTPLKHELIAEIPFAYASEGITICLDQMTMNDQWPLALRVDAFKPEREGLRKAVLNALEEDKNGDLEPATIEAVQAAIDRFRLKFQQLVPPTSPDYIPAHDTIKAMAGLTKMLYSPKVEEILAELEDYQGTTLGDLLSFMQAFNLRFAPANSFRQRRIYLKLYPLLAQQASGTSLPPSVGQAAQAAEGAGREAVGTAENLGTKAVDGLKSAAVDFFKDMDWKHLTGSAAPSKP
jgi:hypothetical protein